VSHSQKVAVAPKKNSQFAMIHFAHITHFNPFLYLKTPKLNKK
jgi:hypothetical protein